MQARVSLMALLVFTTSLLTAGVGRAQTTAASDVTAAGPSAQAELAVPDGYSTTPPAPPSVAPIAARPPLVPAVAPCPPNSAPLRRREGCYVSEYETRPMLELTGVALGALAAGYAINLAITLGMNLTGDSRTWGFVPVIGGFGQALIAEGSLSAVQVLLSGVQVVSLGLAILGLIPFRHFSPRRVALTTDGLLVRF